MSNMFCTLESVEKVVFSCGGNQISSLETHMCIIWTQKHLDKNNHHLLLDLSSESSEGLEEGLVFRLYGGTSLDVLEGHVQFAKLLEGLTSSVQSLDVGGIHIDSCNWSEETDIFNDSIVDNIYTVYVEWLICESYL